MFYVTIKKKCYNNLWCLWCNSSTNACGAFSFGAEPNRYPTKVCCRRRLT